MVCLDCSSSARCVFQSDHAVSISATDEMMMFSIHIVLVSILASRLTRALQRL